MEVIVRVSDPWDLGEEIGWPALRGRVVRQYRSGECVLVRLETPLVVKGTGWTHAFISPRHVGPGVIQSIREAGWAAVAVNLVDETWAEIPSNNNPDPGRVSSEVGFIGDIRTQAIT